MRYSPCNTNSHNGANHRVFWRFKAKEESIELYKQKRDKEGQRRFPDYLAFNGDEAIASSFASLARDLKKTRDKKAMLINALSLHQQRPEFANKFYKDDASTNAMVYRFWNITSASQSVIDEPYYFPLRINRLVVSGYQVGLCLSAPKCLFLPNFYQLLLSKKIPAIHILLQEKDYLLDNDLAKYHIPQLDKNAKQALRLASNFTEKNTLFLDANGIDTKMGKLGIYAEKKALYNHKRSSESRLYKLVLTQNDSEHQVRVLQSTGWADRQAIAPKELNELLEVRMDAFAGLQSSHIITHCRAGVGRTGTLLTAEVMNRLDTSLAKTLVALRDSRNNAMVQNKAQLESLCSWALQQKHRLW